mmetsp:Transcript_15792/g.53204  ORF Transcript_15792/g.53204 Transcript_15792/m.53204 type:complete len:222 (-) Transcript_15792:245-910(-)
MRTASKEVVILVQASRSRARDCCCGESHNCETWHCARSSNHSRFVTLSTFCTTARRARDDRDARFRSAKPSAASTASSLASSAAAPSSFAAPSAPLPRAGLAVAPSAFERRPLRLAGLPLVAPEVLDALEALDEAFEEAFEDSESESRESDISSAKASGSIALMAMNVACAVSMASTAASETSMTTAISHLRNSCPAASSKAIKAWSLTCAAETPAAAARS